jgi:PAS domain S-box-containing protein
MQIAQILVVEDDPIIALELEDRLPEIGYGVCAVTPSGEDAVDRASYLRPDLVLMDVRLKGAMDGIGAAAEIRAHLDIPVVYLTAYADQDTLQRAKLTEPFGYIIKPFEVRDLQAAIEMALYKHRMERKLKESEQWLAITLKSIGDAVIATDSKGFIAFTNAAADALTGWEQREVLGKEAAGTLQMLDRDTMVIVDNPVTRVLEDGLAASLANHLLLTKDGRTIPIDGNIALIKDDQGNVNGAVLVFQDISQREQDEQERESLQNRLFQAQKLEAIGVLIGGIAHDFNNLLTTIIGSSSLVLSGLPGEDPMLDRVQWIKRASERAAALTQQILVLSRGQIPDPRIVDLNAIVSDMKDKIQRPAGENTGVIYDLESGYQYVRADPTQIEQVIMNLVVNAYEAMPQGGKLTIKTESVLLDEEMCQQMPQAQPGTFVRLVVMDTGSGMDNETLQQVFEPFFSTREKGTGLGLTIVRNIVEGYDGWIEAHSEPEQGSTFQVYLPACFADVDYETAGIEPQPEIWGAGERVLLVEDDEGVRSAVSEMLTAGGYVVTGAANAEEAVSVFEREEGNFDLVFSDVVLPDEDGLYLVEWLLSQKPELSILLTSGYSDQRAQWLRISEKGYHFLRKPFGLAELLPVVARALQGDSE